jgi:tetratricopeptide (TPR) repeat protein
MKKKYFKLLVACALFIGVVCLYLLRINSQGESSRRLDEALVRLNSIDISNNYPEYEEALISYHKIRDSMNPDRAKSKTKLLMALIKENDIEKRIVIEKKMLEVDSEDGNVIGFLMVDLMKLGRKDEACKVVSEMTNLPEKVHAEHRKRALEALRCK